MVPKTLAKKIAQSALSKKAYDVVIVDLKKLTTVADFFVICSVDSDTQAKAVADTIKKDILNKGDSPVRREGYSEGRWVLLDYVDVVAHIFHYETRKFYNLEKLWGDAKFEYVVDVPAKKASKGREKKTRTKAAVKKRVRK